ncbi:hypothetical protein MRB53_031322 [Persea americana]|uniref:Uncharacterized protein n=1 Tax=Persea americana TaxID=3435 RepID=A0ACC2KNQ8_PERAE|nr:hypothetical protein MRB53_031322 [Persea americana]
MFDMACLVLATITTTTFNVVRYMTTIDRAKEADLPIQLIRLPIPTKEVGLPDGCKNCDNIPSPKLVSNFFTVLNLLQNPVDQFLKGIQPIPNCIISDMLLPWTSKKARKLGIPRLLFHGPCCYALLFAHNFRQYRPFESVASEHEPFVVPDLHHQIEITKAQCPIEIVGRSYFDKHSSRVEEANNTCYGPESLCNKETSGMAARGNKASIRESQCWTWLDSKKANSVIYACFGHSRDTSTQVENWLEGLEERVKEKGLIIRGWAPQILILSHRAIGGFLTHYGWDSTLEGICAGVPMLTWPVFAEQFFNEKWTVQVQRIGVSVGAKAIVNWGQEKFGEIVQKEDIVTATERLMDEGEEGEERRNRTRELGEKAKRAMEEGGSSYNNMTHLIEELTDHVLVGNANQTT